MNASTKFERFVHLLNEKTTQNFFERKSIRKQLKLFIFRGSVTKCLAHSQFIPDVDEYQAFFGGDVYVNMKLFIIG